MGRNAMRTTTWTAAAVALLAAGDAHAAWTLRQNQMAQGAGYIRVSAGDALHAVAVGTHETPDGNTSGVVSVTTDGGATWASDTPDGGVPAPMGMNIYSWVEMPTPDLAFVTSIGKLLVSTDGGASWTAYREPEWRPLLGPTLQGVSFASPTAGWIVGTDGLVRRSTDGGATWTPLDPPVAGANLTGVLARSATRLWTWSGRETTDPDTGETTGYEGGMLARSVDGGATWAVVFDGEPRAVQRVFMLNDAEGWMLSNSMSGPRLEHTADGGASWSDMPIPSGAAGTPDSAWDVVFFDRCEGLLLVESAENTLVFYTRDRGATWEDQDLSSLRLDLPFPFPIKARLTTFDFASRDAGFAAGFHESLVTYAADGAGTSCGGGTGPGGGGSGDDGCGCRVAGQGGALAVLPGLAALLALVRRRRLR
ncbi:MAG: hypothetical protein HY907_08805 [Deltaproteobacteria bacterium]|nr:hypothetical protein [Deltaproteobacteria bacterium]